MVDQTSSVSSSNLDTISNTALCGHLQAFKYLFTASEELGYKQSASSDYYLAHNAAATGNLNLLKWTFKNTKCKVTDQDTEGLTILHVAALTSNMNIVKWILKNTHLSPIVRTEEGATALHFASWSGNIEIIKELIEAEPRVINMRMNNGATAAMFATQGGFIDIMEFLLNEGANFGLPTVNGVNCLHMAAQQGHLEAVVWLVENTGLRLNGKDDNGITPIHYAAINNHHKVVSWLLEKEVRLLKERYMMESQNSVTISEPKQSVEDLLNSQSNLSVKSICDFSSLESVQEKLTTILSEYNQSIVVTKVEDKTNGLFQCCIPINVLLLLHSALSDVRLQYQTFLRQSYLSDKMVGKKRSEETQTIEMFENSENFSRKYSNRISLKYKEIPRPIIKNDNEITVDMNTYVPPPPPLTLLPTASDSPIISSTNFKKKINGTKSGLHRRGSSSDDIKVSLIQELKKLNILRSMNSQSIYSPDDNESSASNTDSGSVTNNSLNDKNISRITDSAPNLLTIFNSNVNNSVNLLTPKRKPDTVTKPIFDTYKEEDNQKEMPNWKRQILESRGNNSGYKNKRELPEPSPSPIEIDESVSPRASTIIQLINQRQNSSNETK